jgi:hypothetical protein
MPDTLFLFDHPQSVAAWGAIDDRVMGGVSRSALRFDPAGHAVFSGVVSPDNNGGFASVRALVSGMSDVPDGVVDALQITVCGDGRRYKLNLRIDGGFDGVNYQVAFDTGPGAWQRLRLAIEAFRATFRGRPVADAPVLRGARVRQVGLMIADRQFGPFELAIREICTLTTGE